jgi:hypothetical protein
MSEPVVVARAATPAGPTSYVEWGAILAGAVLASAIAFVVMTFGAALGLSFTDSFSGTGMSLTGYVIAIGLWFAWVHISSVMAGAYIAGRLRHRVNDATEHESDVRDGAHGLIVWALATLIGGWLVATTVSSTVRTAGSVAGTAASAATAATGAGMAAGASNPDAAGTTANSAMAYAIDLMFRPATSGSTAPGAPPAGAPAGTPATPPAGTPAGTPRRNACNDFAGFSAKRSAQ